MLRESPNNNAIKNNSKDNQANQPMRFLVQEKEVVVEHQVQIDIFRWRLQWLP